MPSNTPNKGFYLPDTLEDGWDDNKNKDWQILDQIVQNIPNDGDLSAAINNEFGQSLSTTSDVSFASVDTERVLGKSGPSEIRHATEFSGANGGKMINAALNDLPSSGGVVMLSAEGPDNGEWVYDDPLILPGDNIAVVGAGPGATTIRQADGADTIGFNFTDCSDVLFRGFEMDGNRANQTNDQSTHVQLFESNGGSHRITFENLYCHDPVDNCINGELNESDRHGEILIQNCFFDNNHTVGESGYRPGEDHVEWKTADYVTVRGCYFTQAYKASVELERTKHVTVVGNIFEDTAHADGIADAVRVETADDTSPVVAENVSIVGNVFNNIKEKAISAGGGKDLTIANNTITNAGVYGIRIGNRSGIAPTRINISDNVINSTANTTCTNISVKSATETAIADNVVEGGDVGIELIECERVNVSNNRVSNVQSQALNANAGLGNHEIVGNACREYSLGSSTTVDGFSVKDPDCTIRGNRVFYSSAGGKAFNIDGAAARVVENRTDTGSIDSYRTGTFASDTVVARNDPQPELDLSTFKSVPKWTVMVNDGTTGSAGPHTFDGTDWQGFGPASGSTV